MSVQFICLSWDSKPLSQEIRRGFVSHIGRVCRLWLDRCWRATERVLRNTRAECEMWQTSPGLISVPTGAKMIIWWCWLLFRRANRKHSVSPAFQMGWFANSLCSLWLQTEYIWVLLDSNLQKSFVNVLSLIAAHTAVTRRHVQVIQSWKLMKSPLSTVWISFKDDFLSGGNST